MKKSVDVKNIDYSNLSQLLAGKKTIVTGGSRGLGQALCKMFAICGADVAFNYHTDSKSAEETVRLIESTGRKALVYQVSITDRVGIQGMVDDIQKEFGRIDILVNNAAINSTDSFLRMPEEVWYDVIDTNINGTFNITKSVYQYMYKQKYGNIVNISSIAGIKSTPTAPHYAASKGAIIALTKCLAREASTFGIRINCIAAGVLNTGMSKKLPLVHREIYAKWCMDKRLGEPEEVAIFTAFMASDYNSYMAGEVVAIDGGTTA